MGVKQEMPRKEQGQKRGNDLNKWLLFNTKKRFNHDRIVSFIS